MRHLLPGLTCIYGIRGDDLAHIPRGELVEYVRQLDDWASVVSSGVYKPQRR